MAGGKARPLEAVDLDSPEYLDKLMGCWLGKSAGGTLGQPLEQVFGGVEPFDVWWYPELPEGGIANDDLELHLILLKALEEVGPGLRAADLGRYWLAYTGYNWDEYGVNKANQRLGLRPPLSGSYDNYFRDCMGCSVRSEVWACIAPGDPALAVSYAYEDAICDHAGGEGVYGELFDTAIQSAAFVVADREQLLDIGLSWVPPASATARAIGAAREAHAAGRTWLEARAAVLEATPHHVAQYSPINLGFVVIGWLFGDDFGDALCKTVNCGYDTDSSGATLGATLGIVAGRQSLPPRWIDPIGDTIPTNEAWGGVRNLGVGPNPAPTTLTEFAARIVRMAKRVRAMTDGDRRRDTPRSLHAAEDVASLWTRSAHTTRHELGVVSVEVDYSPTPALLPGEERTIDLTITNNQPDPIEVCTAAAHGELVIVTPGPLALAGGASGCLSIGVTAPVPARLANSNTASVVLGVAGWPATEAIPLVFIGAHRFRVSGPYDGHGASADEVLARSFAPDVVDGSIIEEAARDGAWATVHARDRSIPADGFTRGGAATYLQTFLRAPRAMPVRIGISSNAPTRLVVAGVDIVTTPALPLRPSLEGYGQHYGDAVLDAGWNEVLIKVVLERDGPDFEGYLLVSDPQRLFAGIADVGWTRLPWDG